MAILTVQVHCIWVSFDNKRNDENSKRPPGLCGSDDYRGEVSIYPHYALHTLYVFRFYIKVLDLFLDIKNIYIGS